MGMDSPNTHKLVMNLDRFGTLLQEWYAAALPHKKPIIFITIYAVLSVFVMGHFLSSSLLGDRYYRTDYEAMYSGNAWKPFVYRILIPKLTKTIVDSTPIRWQKYANNGVKKWMTDPDTLQVRRTLPWLGTIYNKKNAYPRLVTTAIIYAALWGYIFMIHQLAASLVPASHAFRWIAPIFAMVAISSFSRPWQYIYDIPVLFLASSCYYFLFTRKLKAYLFCFFLACLNRETAIFIFLFFTIWSYKRFSTSTFVTLWVLQCVFYASIKIILTFTYLQNPGWFLENNFFRVLNQDIFAKANFYRIMAVAMIFYLMTARWTEKPAFLKNGLWVLPVIYLAYMVHGNPGEYRVFFDLLPLLILLATHTLTEVTELSRAPFFQPETRKGPSP